MRKITLVLMLLLLPLLVRAQTTFDTGTSRRIATITFSGLGTPVVGEARWCNNCAQSTIPCTGTGTGALAIADGLQWNCPSLSAIGGGGGPATFSNITGNVSDNAALQAALDLKAAKASPALTGVPTSPTAAQGTNTTQIATTAHVVGERTAPGTLTGKSISGSANTLTNLSAGNIIGVIPIANLATGTPTGFKFIRDDGTLQVIPGGGDALVANPLSQFANTTSDQLNTIITNNTGGTSGSLLVFNDSPALINTPTAPTAAAGTNTTQLATTAHVFAERSNTVTFTNKTLTTPTIGSFVNAAHSHQDAAGGAQLNASNVFSAGTIQTARLGSGTANSTTFLRGDQTWVTAGLGNVTGPGFSTDQAVAAWSNAGGTSLQDTSVLISGGDSLVVPNTLTVGLTSTVGGNIALGNATGDTGASFFEANSGDAASNAEPAYLKLWSSHSTKRKASLFPCTDADGVFCIASGTPVADSTNFIVTAANTATLTEKAYNTESSGNVFTSVHKTWFPAAGCVNTTAGSMWDLPTSTPAVAACVTGTNTQKGVLEFADTSGGFSAQNGLVLPADFSGTVDARIIWTTTATSGNAKWSLSTICTAVDATETDDPAFNTASTATTAAPGTANRVQTSSITGVTVTGCAANELMHVKVFRDGNDGADTIAATARLIGVEITTRRSQ